MTTLAAILAELEPELGHRWATWMLILCIVGAALIVLIFTITLVRRRLARRAQDDSPPKSDLTLDAWSEAGRRVSEGTIEDDDEDAEPPPRSA